MSNIDTALLQAFNTVVSILSEITNNPEPLTLEYWAQIHIDAGHTVKKLLYKKDYLEKNYPQITTEDATTHFQEITEYLNERI